MPWYARPAWYLDALLFWALFTGGTLFMIWLLTNSTQKILKDRMVNYVTSSTRLIGSALDAFGDLRGGGPDALAKVEDFLRSILQENPDVSGIWVVARNGAEISEIVAVRSPSTQESITEANGQDLQILLGRASALKRPVLEGWPFLESTEFVREGRGSLGRQDAYLSALALPRGEGSLFLVCQFDSELMGSEFVFLNDSRLRSVLLAVIVGTLLGLLVRRRTMQREEAIDEKLAILNSLTLRDSILGSVASAADRFLTSDSVQEPLQELVGRIGRSLEVEDVMVVDPKGVEITKTGGDMVGFWATLEERWEVLSPGWTGRTALNLQTDVLRGESERLMRRLELAGLVVFPVVSGKEILGYLVLADSRKALVFESGVEDTLRIVADLIGAALVRERNERQFREINKEQALGRMAGGVAHEFNNLLHIISGNLHEAVRAGLPAGEQRQRLSRVAEAARRGTRIVAQLLRATRQSEPDLKRVDLNSVVERTAGLSRSTFPKNIELRLELAKNLPSTALDEDQISQVVLNILLNARDAMPEGGEILVTTGVTSAKGDMPGTGYYVFCRIDDDGPGIESLVKEHIFDPFFTTKPPGKGTGLGLSTSRGIVEQHGGTIEASRSPSGGARLTFYLPVVESDFSVISSRLRETPLEGNGQLVLVADDEPLCLELIREILTDNGFLVVACSDGESLLREAERLGARVAFVVTDWTMPGPSGLDLVKRLRKLLPEARIVVVSGFVISTDEIREIDAVVQKPFGGADLAVAMKGSELVEG